MPPSNGIPGQQSQGLSLTEQQSWGILTMSKVEITIEAQLPQCLQIDAFFT